MAMRSPDAERRRPIRDLLRRLIKAPAALSIFWPAMLLLGGYAAWHRWGAEHVAQKYSGIDPDMIQVTEPPPFVRTDVVQTVYRDTAMEGLSLLDRQATAKIASAFSLHPWVRNVIGVRKLPGGAIDIRLEYRQPVAMVHVFKPDPGDALSYFFPVDGDGVLLPTSDFARSETNQFLHVEVPGVYSTNAVGTPFGDQRVEAAAALAEVLAPYRQEAELHSISVLGDPRLSEIPQLELTRANGTRVFWGSPPHSDIPGEPTVQMKLRQLLDSDPGRDTDLRMAVSPLRMTR